MTMMTDAELAESILRKIIAAPEDWSIKRGPAGALASIECNNFDVTDEEADYLERLLPSQR